MPMKLNRLRFKENIFAPTSKSCLERLLVCALLSRNETRIRFDGAVSQDISAFFGCLKALGAELFQNGGTVTVIPPRSFPDSVRLNCLSSGAALRFFLPLCAVLCKSALLTFSSHLAERPIAPLVEALEKNGAVIKPSRALCGEGAGEGALEIIRGVSRFDFTVRGDVSSQFISGLLFACTVSGGQIKATNKTESFNYILLTTGILKDFGAKITRGENEYKVQKSFPLSSIGEYYAEGDWSNSAFALVGGAIGKNPVTVTGLNLQSVQGDRKILELLIQMGASVKVSENGVTVFPSRLKGITAVGSDIPDIVLPLCVAGVCAEGTTKICGVSRLRYKETDRIESVIALLRALGGDICCEADSLLIKGGRLHGGSASGKNDHRTVMTAALCSTVCGEEIIITDEFAVNKSFPEFFAQFENEGD